MSTFYASKWALKLNTPAVENLHPYRDEYEKPELQTAKTKVWKRTYKQQRRNNTNNDEWAEGEKRHKKLARWCGGVGVVRVAHSFARMLLLFIDAVGRNSLNEQEKEAR